MKKKALFVYNPKAGKAMIRGKLSEILELLEQSGYETTVRPTTKKGDACEYVRDRSPEVELVVCSGGDGTLDEVVTGMLSSGGITPIGYIPAGSTNDFGGSLQLPRNMLRAAQIVVNGRDFPCDVGAFNEDVFVYIAAFGLFTEVSYETAQDVKNVLGHLAYLLEGVKRLSSIRSYPLKVSYEDQVVEDEFIFGMITNSVSVGGFKQITGKNVELDDGVFEVTLIRRPRNPLELNAVVAALLNRDINADCMLYFRTDRLTIESPEPMAWTLDGEYGGSHEKVTIRNRHKAITIKTK
ncbi:MAG: YegS/Rv2252/BmrU family lipid kinase [Lachnospiraceae bacterium]|nr:YegS/Rv2252/BmrU family lipid kinase [Lachnospiraceae bacterium]